MKYTIVECTEKIIAGLSIRTTNENNQCTQDIGTVWQSFIGDKVMEQIPFPCGQFAYGIYSQYEGDATQPYTFLAGIEVSQQADVEGIQYTFIPQGKYAKFTVVGDMQQAVGEAWGKIWAMDLPRAYTYDFEVYHNDSADMSKQTIDLYIALSE